MNTLKLFILLFVATFLGFLVGYTMAYYGTLKLVLTSLNKAITTREASGDPVRRLELPGLTLFRVIVRSRQFDV